MKVVFVNYSHLDSNSGIHIFNLANHLSRLGVECLVCLPEHARAVKAPGEPLFEIVDIAEARRTGLMRNVDLLHVWTPRQAARRLAGELLAERACPYLVHLEDNEEFLLEAVLRIPFKVLKRIPRPLLDLVLRPHMSHPGRYQQFLRGAGGITFVIDALGELCPAGIPTQLIWAGYQEDLGWDRPADPEFRRRLGIAADEFIVGYTGNIHSVNRREVAGLYHSIGLLRAQGVPVRLVRTGNDYARLPDPAADQARERYCIELGHIPRAELPAVLSIADVLVQPGGRGRFNDYRFPSKIPEYLASGKPVILPNTNIGRHLKDGEECLLLDAGDGPDIAEKLALLFAHEALRMKIGAGGRTFAAQNLRWSQIAGKLHAFYLSVLDQVH